MSKKMLEKIMVFIAFAALLAGTCVCAAVGQTNSGLSRDGYTLEQVVVLSRHNIRSPLSGKGSILGEITPHEWFSWSSAPSELSLRGGVLETEMGQFFRKWLESEGLITENYRPEGEEVRIYANSKQRTIATAQYFSAGFLPTANLDIEYHMEFDKMDSVFTPQLTFISDAYAEYMEAETRSLFSDKVNDLADNYALLADVIDMDESDALKNGTASEFRTDDLELIYHLNEEPAMTGSLKTACSVADALVLQYYEEPDEKKAAFGHELSAEQWKELSEIKDLYVDVLYTSPLVSLNVAHPLLQEIRTEMGTEGRLFTFLCGHDSNVASVLAALDTEDYVLPDAIETKTPIGCKLVFSKWSDPDGKAFWSVDLVYLTTEQLREMPLLGQGTAPAIYPVVLSGLERTQNGLYAEDDILERLDQVVEAYDTIVENYSELVPAEEIVPVGELVPALVP